MNEFNDVRAVVVGYNHVEVSVACLQSLHDAGLPAERIVFVDNASADDSATIIARTFPGTHVIVMEENVGFARGYNAGMAHALADGADGVFILNNDTVVDAHTLDRLMEEARMHPEAGIFTPKIYYYVQPDRVWSAGARYRRLPPAVVLRRATGPDDGRFDHVPELEFVTTCALLMSREFLDRVGLLDANFFILHEDYDLSIRARLAGYTIRFVPSSRLWHKVSASTRVGSPNPFVWRHTGRSEAIFRRRHRASYPWLTSMAHVVYILLRMVFEGKAYGVCPFVEGFREGRLTELKPVPFWNNDSVDRGRLL